MSLDLYSDRQLTFITTEACTAACPHCITCCSPEKGRKLTAEQMISAISQRKALAPLSVVIFSGGEPTLLKDDLYRAISFCRDNGILTRIVTNAYWASTPEKAREELTRLRNAGLNELNLSMDDYHAPYVPIERVRTAWKESHGMGFSAVVLANNHGENDRIQPAFIEEFLGEKLQQRDPDHRFGYHPDERREEDGTLYILCEGRLQSAGRAAEQNWEEEKFFHPEAETLRGGCLAVVRQPCVSFSNKLWACCGIRCEENSILCLGDLNEHTMEEILEHSDDSVLINAIHTIGPYDLCRIVTELDPSVTFKSAYHSICEQCDALTSNEKALSILRQNPLCLVQIMRNAEKQRKESENSND